MMFPIRSKLATLTICLLVSQAGVQMWLTSISATGSMIQARVGGVAVALPDGTVLVTGGGSLAGEIYQPR